jgi:Tfp pilus assembly protein PilE
MLELIFVIIILGIVASIGSEIIAKVYEQYIIQRAQHRASIKTELASAQIASRLSYAISGTVRRRVDTNTGEDINSPAGAGNFNVLQWVGEDGDSFKTITSNTNRRPGWSGFADIDAWSTGGTTIATPGSKLSLATTIVGNLSNNGTVIKTLGDASLYFPADTGVVEHPIASVTNTTITLSTAPTSVVEQYKLAWTSYALVTNSAGDLTLYYNFSPSIDSDYTNGQSQLLLRNVSTFRFRGDGRTIRFKICSEEEIGEDFNITSCKEKVVF